MPTDAYQVLMDVSQFTSGAEKIAGGLTLINNKFKDITNVSVQFDDKGRQIGKTFSGMSTEGEKLAITLEKINKNWSIVKTGMTTGVAAAAQTKADLKKFNEDMNRLEKERIAQQKANIEQGLNIGRLAAQTTGVAAGKTAQGIVTPFTRTMAVGTAPDTATAGELFNQSKAIAALKTFAMENNISAKLIQKGFKKVRSSGISPGRVKLFGKNHIVLN